MWDFKDSKMTATGRPHMHDKNNRRKYSLYPPLEKEQSNFKIRPERHLNSVEIWLKHLDSDPENITKYVDFASDLAKNE